jgi:hypothetical protein
MNPGPAHPHKKVSQIIVELAREPKERVRLADLLAVLDERAFGVLMLILSLPNAVGLGAIPGLSTVFGVPQIFVSLQMIVGAKRPWLPGFVLDRSIAMKDFRTMVDKAEPYLVKLERLLRPRIAAISTKLVEAVLGVVLLLLSIAVSLPIPFANQPPAIAQALIALGLIERDGVAVLLGVVVSAVAIALAIIVGGGIIVGLYFAARAVLGF